MLGEGEHVEGDGLAGTVAELFEDGEVTEYDDSLVRRLIERLTVYDDHFTVEFKSGLEVDVEL